MKHTELTKLVNDVTALADKVERLAKRAPADVAAALYLAHYHLTRAKKWLRQVFTLLRGEQ